MGFRQAQLESGVDGVPGQFITETASDFHDYLLERYLLALARLNLCCADLFNTGEDYETVMKVDTAKLRDEKEYVTEIEVDEVAFKTGSIHYLAQYYFKNLWVPGLLNASQENLDFYIRFGQNLTTMGFEQIRSVGEEAIRGIVQVVADLQTRLPILRKFLPGEPRDRVVF